MLLLSSLFAGVLALIVVALLTLNILKKSSGDKKMQEISLMIQDGARTFLKREYKTVAFVVLAIAIIFSVMPLINKDIGTEINIYTAIAFVTGAVCSALAGYIGMSIATRTNAKTTQAAKDGLKPALQISFSGGSVMGLTVVGIGLLGLFAVYKIVGGSISAVNGYAMGASLLALFARSGGGIYTKGADMGADLVGKVEAGIPEDDPRNPAVIADNVGDNVGDIAGMGADLLESYVEAIIATIAIGYAISASSFSNIVLLPFAIAAWGIVSSIIGILWVRFGPVSKAQQAMNIGVYVANIIMAIGSYFIIKQVGLTYESYGIMGPFWAMIAGLITGIIIAAVSEYYSSSSYRPVKRLAESAQSGPAVVVVGGLSIGMVSSLIPVVCIAAATIIGYKVAGMYGIAIGALGMLSTLGITLAVDSYGPVADNAGGISEMTEQKKDVREITDQLDAVGNTTAAIGKGFAIGSAAFSALGLITAYIATLSRFAGSKLVLDLSDPKLLSGLLIGGMIPFVFSSFLAGGVGKIANKIIDEVRRQFKEIKGLMEGKAKPDSSLCVDIATKGALHAMMGPGIMIIVAPVAVGLFLGPIALGGFLVGSLVTGLPLAIQMANSGAALDNAKKYIEEGNFGGKGTSAHKAAVVGDTVGDPLKDTMGPSINILIKLMSVISLVLAPLFAKLM
ncbi:MAG: sodium-translocating pyrophosphatase [Candidatus Ratteibacteria bacterium]|nr:sodium-translocating pyrophosphatase [Candidatus Ratteibacteria bacterium]